MNITTPMYKLSVIIPIYPNLDYLDRALNSLRKQNVIIKETICVLDGFRSAFKEDKIKSEYKDLNVQFFYHQTNQSALQSRLTGCDYITGDVVAFLDKDDELEEGVYCRALIEMINHNADIVGFNMSHRDVGFNGICENNLECVWNYHHKLKHGFCNLVPYIFKADLVKKGLNDLNLSKDLYLNYSEDALFLMAFMCNANVIVENYNLGKYIYHRDNEESTTYKMRKDKNLRDLRRNDLQTIRRLSLEYLSKKRITKADLEYKENRFGVPDKGLKPIFLEIYNKRLVSLNIEKE